MPFWVLENFLNFMIVVTDRIGVICGKGIRPPKLGGQTTDDVAVDNCMSGWLVVGFTSYWQEHQLIVSRRCQLSRHSVSRSVQIIYVPEH